MRLKYRVIGRFRGIYPIEAMCEVFEVSRSGYYAWRRVQKKMPRDQWLIDLMVQCQQQCNQDLRHPPCSPLNPAAEGKNGESKGTSARHAQDQSTRTDQAAKDIYAAQTACVQISEPVAAGL